MAFPKELLGSVWHTTSIERFRQILLDKAILPEPPTITDSERWKASKGADLYPYVRMIGGVSLFDFRGFDEDKYSRDYPLSSWAEFVPRLRKWKTAVWIEIDINAVSKNLILGHDLVAKWKEQGAYKHTIMPIIEVAHVGPLPISAFQRILTYSENTSCFRRIDESKYD